MKNYPLTRVLFANNGRKILSIALLLTVMAAIPLTVYIAQQNQDIRQRAASNKQQGPTWRMFLSSKTFDGNLGGISGADAMCQQLATSSALNGSWIAYLYDSHTKPYERMAEGTFEDMKGKKLAKSIKEWLDSAKEPKVDENEKKVKGKDISSWQGGNFDTPIAANCNDWTSNIASNSAKLNGGGSSNCNQQRPLLCVEVAASASATLTPSVTPGASASATPTPGKNSRLLYFNVTLTGVGIGSTSGTFTPLHKDRQLTVQLYEGDNKKNLNNLVAEKTGTVSFVNVATSGAVFTGTIEIGKDVPKGIYTIKVKTPQFLRKQLSGVQLITWAKTSPFEFAIPIVYADATDEDNNEDGKPHKKKGSSDMPAITLPSGDINNDNKVDILDYNLLVSCYGDKASSSACGDNKTRADLNDDGVIDGIDYNLFIRGLSVKEGD